MGQHSPMILISWSWVVTAPLPSFLAVLHGLWDLSSPTLDWTRPPCPPAWKCQVLTTEPPGTSPGAARLDEVCTLQFPSIPITPYYFIDPMARFSSVHSLSCLWLFVTPWTTARQASLSITNSRSLPKLMSIESVMPSNHLILSRPLLLLPSVFPNIRVFSNESALSIRWPKYCSFRFNISFSSEHPGLISFTILVGSPCSPRDSQEFSPTPQFKSINSLALSFLYSPTLTTTLDYWKKHSLD